MSAIFRPSLLQRPRDDLLEQRLLRGVAADTVTPDGVEAEHGPTVAAAADEDRHAGQHVLEHRHAAVEACL